MIDPLYTKGVVFFGIGLKKKWCFLPLPFSFNKEANNSLCVSWSCKELLKKN
jgi:hypothetical protein